MPQAAKILDGILQKEETDGSKNHQLLFLNTRVGCSELVKLSIVLLGLYAFQKRSQSL